MQLHFLEFLIQLLKVKFDKNALYIRKYLPEIAKLPNKFIFTPWLADKEILSDANITLGLDYPYPIIDYTSSRKKFGCF